MPLKVVFEKHCSCKKIYQILLTDIPARKKGTKSMGLTELFRTIHRIIGSINITVTTLQFLYKAKALKLMKKFKT